MSTQLSIDRVRVTTHLGPKVVKLLQSYEARIAELEEKVEELQRHTDYVKPPSPSSIECSMCKWKHDPKDPC